MSIALLSTRNAGPLLAEPVALLRLAVPLVLIALVNMGMSLTDTLMVSASFGAEALAAVAVASDFQSILFYLGAGTISGIAPLYSAAAARLDNEGRERLERAGQAVVLLLALILGPTLWTAPDWLPLLGLDRDLLDAGRGYARAMALTLVPLLGVTLYVSGETHFFFGKPFRLMVQPNDKNRCEIRPDASDRLTMLVPAGSTPDQKARWMATWYRSQLREKAAPRIAKWSDRLGVPIPRWGIRLMKTKWGSCNPEKGLVWLNLDLAKKPLAALDYVILHELAHFVSPRHDELFLSTLDRNMPGWRQVRSDLNALPLSE